MDFSEIIVAIIIGAVILAINSVGSKKQQGSKNQPRRRPSRPVFPEEPASVEEHEETWGTPPTFTLDDIFNELRRAREEEERKAREEDAYIPRTPKTSRHRQQTPARPQNLERTPRQVDWRPKPHPVQNIPTNTEVQTHTQAQTQAQTQTQAQPRHTVHTPNPEEGTQVPVHTSTRPQPAPQPSPIYDNDDTTFDANDIDWRKAVIASEILNRKY